MFSESAELYDAIYFTFKDYAAEAVLIAKQIRERVPAARSLLDVACGTGEHARLLAENHGFEVDGIDLNPDFVRIAATKNQSGRFALADMVDFDMGRSYDAVICMFSSIAYVRTLARVEQALRCFARHVTDEGLVLVEPWFPPGALTDGYRSVHEAHAGEVHVERVAHTEIVDRISRLRFDFTLTRANGTRHATELHELGLFTVEEMMAAFGGAGLAVEFIPPVAPHRGLYVARRETRPRG
jgi:SAM-dependent methyltransferase